MNPQEQPQPQSPQQPNPFDTPEFHQAATTVSAAMNGQAPVQSAPQAPQDAITVKFEDDLILYVTADKVDDMRFMELFDLVSENNMKLPKLLRFMFGEKEFDSIYQYYESRGQRFSMTKMEKVFNQFNEDMNANPDFLRR